MFFKPSKPIAIASDHAGFDYKVLIVEWLKEMGYDIKDFGVHENTSVDYPDYAHIVAENVEGGKVAFGILFCGSANGVCMTANKHEGIRAAICWQNEIAKLSRLHNNANVICLPARFISIEDAKQILQIFMETEFEGGRHQRRVDKILFNSP